MMKSVSPQKAQRRTQKTQDRWKAGFNHKEYLWFLYSSLRFLWSIFGSINSRAEHFWSIPL
jgi:hypothetical protein